MCVCVCTKVPRLDLSCWWHKLVAFLSFCFFLFVILACSLVLLCYVCSLLKPECSLAYMTLFFCCSLTCTCAASVFGSLLLSSLSVPEYISGRTVYPSASIQVSISDYCTLSTVFILSSMAAELAVIWKQVVSPPMVLGSVGGFSCGACPCVECGVCVPKKRSRFFLCREIILLAKGILTSTKENSQAAKW